MQEELWQVARHADSRYPGLWKADEISLAPSGFPPKLPLYHEVYLNSAPAHGRTLSKIIICFGQLYSRLISVSKRVEYANTDVLQQFLLSAPFYHQSFA